MMTGICRIKLDLAQARADKEAPDAKTLFGVLKSNDYQTHSTQQCILPMILRTIGPLYRGSQEHGMGHRNYLLEENINFLRNIRLVPH